MDISKKVYQQLTPIQRAIAFYKSITRDDQSEVERLLEHAPKFKGHGQAVLALGQAMDAYNSITSNFMRDFLLINGKLQASVAYCEAWQDAGGGIGGVKVTASQQSFFGAAVLSPAYRDRGFADPDTLDLVRSVFAKINFSW